MLRDKMDDAVADGCMVGFLALVVAGGIGWCLNVYKLAVSLSDPLTALIVLRALGVLFPPLGAVVGYV